MKLPNDTDHKDLQVTKEKKPYLRPTLTKHNEIVENTQQFSVGGPPMPGPPAGAQASPTVPGAVVF